MPTYGKLRGGPRVSVTCSPSGSGSGSSSKKLPVRPLGDFNTVKNQDGLSSDGDVLPLASFFLPVFRVAADIFARKPGCYQVHQPGWAIGARIKPRAVRRRSLRSHGDERRRRGAQKALTDDSPAISRSNPPVIPLHDAGGALVIRGASAPRYLKVSEGI